MYYLKVDTFDEDKLEDAEIEYELCDDDDVELGDVSSDDLIEELTSRCELEDIFEHLDFAKIEKSKY
jgi:hypothetical protein